MRRFLLFVAVLLSFSLFGCAGGKGGAPADAPVDAAALSTALYESGLFEDELTLLDEKTAAGLYHLPEKGVSALAVYVSTGATAEEIAVFACEDEAAAKKVEALAKERIESQQEAFSDYLPAETKKLGEAEVIRSGSAVALCVAEDFESAKKIISDFLSGK